MFRCTDATMTDAKLSASNNRIVNFDRNEITAISIEYKSLSQTFMHVDTRARQISFAPEFELKFDRN